MTPVPYGTAKPKRRKIAYKMVGLRTETTKEMTVDQGDVIALSAVGRQTRHASAGDVEGVYRRRKVCF